METDLVWQRVNTYAWALKPKFYYVIWKSGLFLVQELSQPMDNLTKISVDIQDSFHIMEVGLNLAIRKPGLISEEFPKHSNTNIKSSVMAELWSYDVCTSQH